MTTRWHSLLNGVTFGGFHLWYATCNTARRGGQDKNVDIQIQQHEDSLKTKRICYFFIILNSSFCKVCTRYYKHF